MRKRSKQNRYTPQGSGGNFPLTRILMLALAVLVIALLIEIFKPHLHQHAKPVQQSLSIPQKQTNGPSLEFYKVLPKVSLDSVHLNNLPQTTQALQNPTQTASKVDHHTYSLQMASLKDVDQATALANKINHVKNLGHYKALVSMRNKGKTTWYIVNLGPFPTKQDAEDMQNKLDRHYYSGMIFQNN